MTGRDAGGAADGNADLAAADGGESYDDPRKNCPCDDNVTIMAMMMMVVNVIVVMMRVKTTVQVGDDLNIGICVNHDSGGKEDNSNAMNMVNIMATMVQE